MDKNNDERLNDLIDTIAAMARLDFSKRLDVEVNDEPVNLIAYGLNMLSEELEASVVKKSMLEEVNKNLEHFAYTAAHDIKSPLASASSLLSLIELELESCENETLKQYIGLLIQINERTREMITGILEYSKTNFNAINIDDVDLKEILDEIKQTHSVDDHITISYKEALPIIKHNKTALTQILTNLINNAIKHNDKANCNVEVQCGEDERFYTFEVSDNGPGIAEKDRERIFDLFENLQYDKEDSHGIGLSIVKKLVDQSNGSIQVDSEEGKGATFIFTLEKRYE